MKFKRLFYFIPGSLTNLSEDIKKEKKKNEKNEWIAV